VEILVPADCARARDLFAAPRLRLSLDALIAGNSPGTLWVDDPAAPRSALMWDGDGSVALAGDANNAAFLWEAASVIAEQVLARQRSLKIRYADLGWEGAMEALFPGAMLSSGARVLYSFGRVALPDWRSRVPEGFAIRAVDEAFLAADGLANIGRLRAEVAAHWPSVERYLARGFGYCALHGDEVAGWCDGGLASPGKISITIETMESYRQRGLATLMASAFLERCQREGIAPYWDAWADNWGSIATAERIGLARIDAYAIRVYGPPRIPQPDGRARRGI